MTFVQHSMLLLKCFKNIFKMLFLHQMYDIKNNVGKKKKFSLKTLL